MPIKNAGKNNNDAVAASTENIGATAQTEDNYDEAQKKTGVVKK